MHNRITSAAYLQDRDRDLAASIAVDSSGAGRATSIGEGEGIEAGKDIGVVDPADCAE